MKTLLPFGLLATSILTAHSAIVIGNLANFNTTDTISTTGINYTPANPAATPPVTASYGSKAVGFTMSSTPYTVDNVILRLTGVSASGADTPVVRIYQANAGGTAPSSTLVGSFTNPTFTSTASTAYTFTPSGLITLAAGTTYFLTVQQLNTEGADLSFIWDNGGDTVGNPNTLPTGIGATNGVARFGGGPAPTSITSTSGRFNWYEINGTAVPEPSSALLLLSGAALAIGRRRR